MKKKLMTLQQHRLLKEAGRLIAFSERLKHAQKETTGRNREEREEKCRRSAKAASAVTALSGDIEEFLASRYDFRYNLLTDETEFRPAGQRKLLLGDGRLCGVQRGRRQLAVRERGHCRAQQLHLYPSGLADESADELCGFHRHLPVSGSVWHAVYL